MRKSEPIEAYDPRRCCATCTHNRGHKCEMYQQKGIIIAFDHRLVRCNWFEAAETDTRAAIPNGSYRAVSEGVSHTHSEFDERVPDREGKLCKHCGQPMKPKGVKKRPFEYNHAQGCPYSHKREAK